MNTSHTAEHGAVLIGAVLLVSMLLVLGVLSLNLATQEVESATASKEDAAARYAAESGAELVLQWFHDPGSVPNGVEGQLFTKRFDLPGTGASFFDHEGRSQFTGTEDNPDLLVDGAGLEGDRVQSEASTGTLRGWRNLGGLLRLRAYGPARPGWLATLDVTVGTLRGPRTMVAQVGTYTIPQLRAGIQVRRHNVTVRSRQADTALPLWVHWGDLRIRGDVALGRVNEVPRKSALASVTGQSYASVADREDRWLDLFIGGAVHVKPSVTGEQALPFNIHANQDPVPGLKFDEWEYEDLKRAAQQFGTYYVLGTDGFLYPDGVKRYNLRQTADEVFASRAVGDHRGLIFIDTPDQRPPQSNNLHTLSVTTPYAEGIFVVNAHMLWRPRGNGRTLPALSPPPEGSASLASCLPVQLLRINLQGILYTAGNLQFGGWPRLYGALAVDGDIVRHAAESGKLEVWYNHELGSGLVRGMPLVYIVPGTLRERR